MFNNFYSTYEITSSKECCKQHWVFASERAHKNMPFNVEPRASANTHSYIQGCPENQGKTNKNWTQKKKAPEVHIFAREWTVPVWPARNLCLLPFLKPFPINIAEWGDDIHSAHTELYSYYSVVSSAFLCKETFMLLETTSLLACYEWPC